jgi:hypothetical protein
MILSLSQTILYLLACTLLEAYPFNQINMHAERVYWVCNCGNGPMLLAVNISCFQCEHVFDTQTCITSGHCYVESLPTDSDYRNSFYSNYREPPNSDYGKPASGEREPFAKPDTSFNKPAYFNSGTTQRHKKQGTGQRRLNISPYRRPESSFASGGSSVRGIQTQTAQEGSLKADNSPSNHSLPSPESYGQEPGPYT